MTYHRLPICCYGDQLTIQSWQDSIDSSWTAFTWHCYCELVHLIKTCNNCHDNRSPPIETGGGIETTQVLLHGHLLEFSQLVSIHYCFPISISNGVYFVYSMGFTTANHIYNLIFGLLFHCKQCLNNTVTTIDMYTQSSVEVPLEQLILPTE